MLSNWGANLNFNFAHDPPPPDNHYFSCRNQRVQNGLCNKFLDIRVNVLTHLFKNDISNIIQFAAEFEDKLTKTTSSFNQHKRKILKYSIKRWLHDKELDTLCEKVFEEKILGNLSEYRFLKLSEKYENE